MTAITPIATVTVGSGGAASITFSDIPQTYTDLYLVVSARNSNSGYSRGDILLRVNGSTSGYSERHLFGYDSGNTGSNSLSGSYFQAARVPSNAATSNTFGIATYYFPNYTSSSSKSLSNEHVTENNSSSSYILGIVAGLWTGTAPITSISFTSDSGYNFVEHSTASLFGITAGSDGIVAVS